MISVKQNSAAGGSFATWGLDAPLAFVESPGLFDAPLSFNFCLLVESAPLFNAPVLFNAPLFVESPLLDDPKLVEPLLVEPLLVEPLLVEPPPLIELPPVLTGARAAAAGINAVFGHAEPSTSHPLGTGLSAYWGSGNAQAGGVLKHFLRISQLLSHTEIYEKSLSDSKKWAQPRRNRPVAADACHPLDSREKPRPLTASTRITKPSSHNKTCAKL
jgi:hypothetical protein